MRVRRSILIAVGVFLLFVPTAFGVFVEWTDWPTWARLAVLLTWLIAAAFVVWGSVVHGEQVEGLLGTVQRRRSERRQLAARRVLASLLKCGTELPDHYLFRVFVYDADADRLIVSYDPEGRHPPATWKPGQGATGAAWKRKKYVLAEGDAVADDTFGLTADQKETYKDLKVVAATPVHDDKGNVIAVLTGSSKVDDGVLASGDGFRKQEELAIIVGRVLIDLLGDDGA